MRFSTGSSANATTGSKDTAGIGSLPALDVTRIK